MSTRCTALLLAIGLALPACAAGSGRGASPEVTVVATTSILGDVVANVLGDVGDLVVLMPAGVDPHGYEPSAADARQLREADLVVANGLHLEAGLVDALEAAESEGTPVLHLAEELDPIPFAGVGHGQEEEAQSDEGAHVDAELDPHVWFDPVRMADGVTLIAERLAEILPGSAEELRRNGDDHRRTLLDLHARVEAILAAIPPDARKLVTNHDSLGYLAARYDLEVVGTVVPGGTTLGEASSRELTELVGTIREAGVPAIFVESTARDRLARTVSGELEGEVDVIELFTGSLGPEGSGADTYLGMLETDARRIADGLAR